MNEAAGFIMDVPNSAYFAHTLRRAIGLAERHAHRLVTLEHLLMALLDDPDAKDMLEGVQADLAVLRVRLGEVISRQMGALHSPGAELRPSLEYDRVLAASADLATRSPRGERDGAFALAALAWEPEGPAANLLRQCGLTSDMALAWLNRFRSGAPKPKSAPALVSAPRPVSAVPSPPPAPPSRAAEPPSRAAEPLNRVSEPPSRVPEPPSRVPEPPSRAAESPRPARSESQESPEETLEEMLARVRSILDDDAPSDRGPAPEPPAPPAGSWLGQALSSEMLSPSAARTSHMRQAEGAVSPPPPPPPTPARAPMPQERPPERPHPLPFGGLPRTPAAANMAPPPPGGWDASQPIAPSRSLAPIPQMKPRSELGKLVENIPRSMRVAVPERIEVRLSREETAALLSGFQGRGEVRSHTVAVTRAMSVMLRAPEGGFIIENLSPETQWIVDRPNYLETEPFGRWRWMVTPMQRGEHKLLLLISARNVDDSGMIGDTPLPDQTIEVEVQTNYRRSARIFARWAALLAAGGLITEAAAWTFRLLAK